MTSAAKPWFPFRKDSHFIEIHCKKKTRSLTLFPRPEKLQFETKSWKVSAACGISTFSDWVRLGVITVQMAKSPQVWQIWSCSEIKRAGVWCICLSLLGTRAPFLKERDSVRVGWMGCQWSEVFMNPLIPCLTPPHTQVYCVLQTTSICGGRKNWKDNFLVCWRFPQSLAVLKEQEQFCAACHGYQKRGFRMVITEVSAQSTRRGNDVLVSLFHCGGSLTRFLGSA